MRPDTIEQTDTTAALAAKPTPAKRKPGRPPGSRNRPRIETAPAVKPVAMRPEAAGRYIGVSTTTVRRLIGKGELETRRVGSAVVVLVRSLDRLVGDER
jgi:hypothetical protein